MGSVVAMQDITHHKRAEQEIRKLNLELERRVTERTAELAEANQDLKNFAYAASHDLKTPVRAICQLAGWVSEGYVDVIDEEGRRHLTLLLGRARRLENLIEGIFQYWSVNSDRSHRQEVDLESLVTEVVKHINPPEHILSYGTAKTTGEKASLQVCIFTG